MVAPIRLDQNSVGAPDIFAGAGALNAWLRFGLVNSGLGWTEPFAESGSVGVFHNGDYYLRVNDSNALYAEVLGYETMSDLNTGTNPFPATGTLYFARYWTGSFSADIQLYGNDKFFNLINKYGVSVDYNTGLSFGTYPGHNSGDLHKGFISAQDFTVGNNSSIDYGRGSGSKHLNRAITAVAGSVAAEVHGMLAGVGTSYFGSFNLPNYPTGVVKGTVKVPWSRLYITEASDEVRGYWPGVIAPAALRPYSEGQIAASNYWAKNFYSNAQLIFTAEEEYWNAPAL